MPLLPNVPNVSKSEPVASSYVPPVAPAPTIVPPPVLPNNMDINELFKKLVDSGIVPKDKPKEIVQPKIKKKEKEAENLTIKSVDFSDPSSLKQLVIFINICYIIFYIINVCCIITENNQG